MIHLVIIVLSSVFLSGVAIAQNGDANPVPDWYVAQVEYITRDGGVWIAANDEFSESNPFQSYGIEWTAMPGDWGMTGRLYGIREDGGTAEFWQFREFWHAGEHRVQVMQWGLGGAFGDGEMIRMGDGFSTVQQSFYWPNGAMTVGGHILRIEDDDTHLAEQYLIDDEQGQWVLEHVLTFRRQSR